MEQTTESVEWQVARAAESWGVSRRTVRDWCQRGLVEARWEETPRGGYWVILQGQPADTRMGRPPKSASGQG